MPAPEPDVDRRVHRAVRLDVAPEEAVVVSGERASVSRSSDRGRRVVLVVEQRDDAHSLSVTSTSQYSPAESIVSAVMIPSFTPTPVGVLTPCEVAYDVTERRDGVRANCGDLSVVVRR